VIDVYAHVLPQRYFARADKLLADAQPARVAGYHGWFREFPALVDLDARWRLIDGLDDYRQILVLAVPPIEELGSAATCAELARLANDEMAELVAAHPDRFAGFAAALPFGEVEASLAELERAVRELGALGMLAYTNVAGVPIDDPRYAPLFERTATLGGAVWLHPTRGSLRADYESEPASRFGLWWSLGWPVETSVAMARLVYSGLFERHPELPVITHHGGGMVPAFADRLVPLAAEEVDASRAGRSESIAAHLARFHVDTVLGGSAALRSSIEFFGLDRVMFGTDMPFGQPTMVHDVVATVEALGLSDEARAQLFHGNATRALYQPKS
jgi:predicted TIM-barrel fold metal-dependent hydrolase